jgi:hypothetical protein
MGNIYSRTEMADLFAATINNISSHIQKSGLSQPNNLVILAVALSGAEVARRVIKFRAALAAIGNLPGRRTAVGPYTLLASLLPQIPYINLPAGWQFKEKYSREWDVLPVQCLGF